MRDDRPTEKKVPRRTPQRAHNSYITDATAVREDPHQAACIHKKEAEEGEKNRWSVTIDYTKSKEARGGEVGERKTKTKC